MTSVDKVKSICKERKIPISRLERDLKYANGYIGQLRKGTFPDDRLVEIANYLNVPTWYLTGEEQKENPTVNGEVNLDDPYLIQLFEIAKQADEAGKKFLIATAKNYIESRKEK